MGVCSWRLCEETSDMILTEGLDQQHALLDIRVDQDCGGCVWKGPREWCNICNLAILSFSTVNVE